MTPYATHTTTQRTHATTQCYHSYRHTTLGPSVVWRYEMSPSLIDHVCMYAITHTTTRYSYVAVWCLFGVAVWCLFGVWLHCVCLVCDVKGVCLVCDVKGVCCT